MLETYALFFSGGLNIVLILVIFSLNRIIDDME